jgi:hypothetical protein
MLQEAMFPVIEVPAIGIMESTESGIDYEDIDNTGYKFIVREDTGTILSCMTDDYKLVKNETIINYAGPVIKKNKGVLKEVRVFGNGAKTTMKWQFPEQKVHIGPNDDISPEIVIRNSYDGTVGVNILAGAFRLVCTNGMIIGVVLDNYRNKHSVYNIELDKLEQSIVDTIEKTKYMFEDEFPTLINTQIKEKHIVNFIKIFPIQANTIITQRLIVDKPKTFWDLFNVGTNVLTHSMNRNAESTHHIENSLYPTIKKWAATEVARA